MFRFSADQQHALRHGLQDFGKLTLAVMFLSSSLGLLYGGLSHPDCEKTHSDKPAQQAFSPHKNLSDALNARL